MQNVYTFNTIIIAEIGHHFRHFTIFHHMSFVCKHTAIDELDRELLLQLIDKICVGQKTEENGRSTQKITIIYNFRQVGLNGINHPEFKDNRPKMQINRPL